MIQSFINVLQLDSHVWYVEIFHEKFTLIFIHFALTYTVYGCQDRKDDIKIGIWSTALLFGNHVKTAAALCDIAFVVFLYLAGKANGHGLPFYVICVGGSVIQFIYQLLILDIDSTQSCWGMYLLPKWCLPKTLLLIIDWPIDFIGLYRKFQE